MCLCFFIVSLWPPLSFLPPLAKIGSAAIKFSLNHWVWNPKTVCRSAFYICVSFALIFFEILLHLQWISLISRPSWGPPEIWFMSFAGEKSRFFKFSNFLGFSSDGALRLATKKRSQLRFSITFSKNRMSRQHDKIQFHLLHISVI